MNINKEIFRRYSKENKLKLIEKASLGDLLAINLNTYIRIIKEAGTGNNANKRNHNKVLKLGYGIPMCCPIKIKSIEIFNKNPFITADILIDNQNITRVFDLIDFVGFKDFDENIAIEEYNGNPKYYYITMSKDKKAEVIKEVLKLYICRK